MAAPSQNLSFPKAMLVLGVFRLRSCLVQLVHSQGLSLTLKYLPFLCSWRIIIKEKDWRSETALVLN